MQDSTPVGLPVAATSELTNAQTAAEPDETWSDDLLLDYGREAMKEGDRLEAQAQPFIRQSIGSRLRGGRAWSILRARLRAGRQWFAFQQQHGLPRTTVWQMAEIYERATEDHLSAEDLADKYSTWTGILMAYGLAQPRNTASGGSVVEQLEPPDDDEDATEHEGVDNDLVEGNPEGEDLDDGLDEGEPEDDLPDAAPQETAEEEPPPVTDDQVAAADTFVGAVGGLEHAARALIARSVRAGDREAVKGTLAEAVRAARAVLTASEISEIVIVGNGKAKGIRWEPV